MHSIANEISGVKAASARQDGGESRVYTYTQEFTVIIRDVSTKPYMNHGEYVRIRKSFGQSVHLVCIGCSEPFKDSDDFYICIGGSAGIGNPHMCRRCAEDYHRDKGAPIDEMCATEYAADGSIRGVGVAESFVPVCRRSVRLKHNLLPLARPLRERSGGAR